MKYRAEILIPPVEKDLLRFNEEKVYRELVHRMVAEIPVEHLQKLFNTWKEDPELPHEPTTYRAEIIIEI